MNERSTAVHTKRVRLAPLALLGVPLVYLAMATLIDRPFVFPDEAGAITNARHLAGQGDPSPWWYLPGYGAFVAPVLAATRDLGVVTRAFQVLNAILGLLSVTGLFLFGRRRFPDVDRRVVAVASAVTLVYPAFVYFGSLAIADNALVAAGIWSVLAVEHLRSRPSHATAVAIVLAFGLAATLHSRAIVIVAAAGLSLILSSRRWLGVSTLLVGVASSLAARTLIDGGADTVHAAGSRQSIFDLLEANASIRSLAVLPFTLLGQIINLTAATLGLAAVGVMVIGARVWDRRTRWSDAETDSDRHLLLLIALTAILSALFTNQGQGDLAMYGRYLEVVLPIPLLIGLLTVVEREPPAWMRSSGPALLVVSACVLVAIRGYDAFEGRVQYLNIAGIGPAVRPFNRIDPILIALFGALGVILLARLAERSRLLVMPVVVLAFFGSMLVPFERSIAYLDRVEEEAVLADLIDAVNVDGARCVGLDQAGLVDPWAQENYQVLLLDVPFAVFDSSTPASPCGDLVISSRPDLGERLVGWSPIGWERNRAHWLWASPDVLAEQDASLPIRPDPGTPLGSLASSISVDVAEPDTENRMVEALATVTNDSASTFVPPFNLPDGTGAVRVGVEWRNVDDPDTRIHEPQRFDLVEPLRPGATQQIPVELSRDLPGVSVDDGRWILRVELVQELVQWAGNSGAGAVTVDWVGQ